MHTLNYGTTYVLMYKIAYYCFKNHTVCRYIMQVRIYNVECVATEALCTSMISTRFDLHNYYMIQTSIPLGL